jgi:tetratricopeptide (TPR) repeat protein
MQQWKNAIRVLERALKFSDVPNDLQGLLARAQINVGDKNAAVENYRVYLEKAGRDSAAWYELGNLYFEQKKYAEAAKTLEKASTIMGSNFDLLKKIGIAYVRASTFKRRESTGQEPLRSTARTLKS